MIIKSVHIICNDHTRLYTYKHVFTKEFHFSSSFSFMNLCLFLGTLCQILLSPLIFHLLIFYFHFCRKYFKEWRKLDQVPCLPKFDKSFKAASYCTII